MKHYPLILVDEENVIDPAITCWGSDKQLTHCVEEMSELTVRIMQFLFRKDRPDKMKAIYPGLLEELADARLMIDCAIKAVGKEEVEAVMQTKIAKMFGQMEKANGKSGEIKTSSTDGRD